eukprot:4279215-Prymnesium_polylepis.1
MCIRDRPKGARHKATHATGRAAAQRASPLLGGVRAAAIWVACGLLPFSEEGGGGLARAQGLGREHRRVEGTGGWRAQEGGAGLAREGALERA